LRPTGAAPRKQRHTARRIWRRLVDEHGARVAERTVREYVAARRRELGERGRVFVPQIHQAGIEAEVDWGEAQVVLAGRPVTAPCRRAPTRSPYQAQPVSAPAARSTP
jgi:hypothetical protein